MRATPLPALRIPPWFVVCVLLILLIPVTTFILNHSSVPSLLAHYLRTELGIEISAIRVRFVPDLSLEVSDLVIRDSRNSEPTLRAPRASVSLRLWPLLTQRMRILELHAVDPEVVIRRDKDGIWHIPLADKQNHTQPSNTTEPQWLMTKVHLVDGSLLILDEDRLAPEGLRIHQVQAALEANQLLTHAEVELTGKTDDGGQLQINGSLALRHQASADTTDARILPVQFEGALRFHRFHLDFWLERTRQTLPAGIKEASWEGDLAFAIRLDLLPGTKGLKVTVSNLSTNLGWLQVHGDGVIEHAGTTQPVYAIRLSTSPVDSDAFFTHIPASWIPKRVQDVVREHHLKSTVELASATLRGSIDVLREPDEWTIVAKLSDGSGVWEERRTRIHDLSATVAMDPHGATVTDFSGDVNGVHVSSTTLTVSHLDLGASVDARFVGVGNIEQLAAVLQQFDGGTGKSVLRGMRDLTGTFHLAVHLAGPILPKPSIRLITAEVGVQNMAVRLPQEYSVAQVNGSLTADSRFLEIKQLQGVIQGVRFEAQGTVDVDSPHTEVTGLTVHLWSDGRTIRELLTSNLHIRSDIHVEGPAHAILAVSGTAVAARCRTTIDLTGTDFAIPSVLHKRKGVPARVEFEADVIKGRRVIIDGFKLVLLEHPIEAGAHVDLDRTSKFHLHVKSGPISLRALTDLGIETPLREGVLEASAVVTGEGTNWKSWNPSGWVTIRNGVAAIRGVEDHVSELSGRLQLTQRGAALDNLSFKIGDSDVKLTGMVEQWRHHPRTTVMVESSHLDLTKLVSNTANGPPTTSANLQEWIQSKETSIAFLIKQLQYERLVLRTVSGEIKARPDSVKLNTLRGQTPNGVLFGRAEARLGPRQQLDVDAELNVDGLRAQDLLSTGDRESEPLQGNLSLDGVIQATVNGDTPLRETLNTAQRGIAVKLSNGRLQQDPVLTKVLKILNIPAVLAGRVDLNHGGIPFHSLTARLIARDGVFSSEDIVFDSPIIKVTGAGTADLKQDGLNLALAVSPLAAYSDLVGKIPLFGPLLGGDHAGISTALFEAKGSLRDPNVEYLPLESFGRGLTGYPRLAIDVLFNTMALPHTALAYATTYPD